ncbi:ATP-dependent DNA helicase RecQ-like [Branchiostoma floridae x Branchiostoma japonicum]
MLTSSTYREKLVGVAVDEAHCVTTWGDEFRKDYKRLAELRILVADVSVLALTATASDDIKQAKHYVPCTETKKNFVLEQFTKTVRITIATAAFGIDVPDAFAVVHWGALRNVEGFYQVTGRAGRDGSNFNVLDEFLHVHSASLTAALLTHMKMESTSDDYTGEEYIYDIAKSFLRAFVCKKKQESTADDSIYSLSTSLLYHP